MNARHALSQNLADRMRMEIVRFDLGAAEDLIFANAAECYAMLAEEDDDYSIVGNTRFGGAPDLPNVMNWPCTGDPNDGSSRFSNFIAQINFEELPPLASARPLPQHGILFLFLRKIECAAEPVVLDGLYFDGNPCDLRRRDPPDIERMCNDDLTALKPVRVRGVPAVSLASFRKSFRETVARLAGSDGEMRMIEFEAALRNDHQIGQVLGFANAADSRQNLYRQVHLGRVGQRDLIFNDYWESMAEYEACLEKCRSSNKEWQRTRLVERYEEMRPGVTWLTANQEAIAKSVAEWRLLCRIDSNSAMDFSILDSDPLYAFIRNPELARGDFSNLAGEVTQG